MKTLRYLLLGLISLTSFPVLGTEDTSNPNTMTISIYSGIGDVNLGGLTGIGTEVMYKNVSVNVGIGTRHDNNEGDLYCRSVGIKVYNSGDNPKNKVFGAFNYIRLDPYDDPYKYLYCYAATAGLRHTYSNGIYLSPYAGTRIGRNISVCYGLNVGYQFNL